MEDQQNIYSNGNRGDEDARKLFIGGLPASATKNDLEEYFGAYGEVEMCTIKTDQMSGRSRGFGFLIFKSADAVTKVLAVGEHQIHDKKIDPKLATPQGGDGGAKSTKVFVGGLDKTITKEEITSAFSQRGTVVDVYLPMEKESGQPKGFAFVNFDNSDIVQTLLREGKITIGNAERHC